LATDIPATTKVFAPEKQPCPAHITTARGKVKDETCVGWTPTFGDDRDDANTTASFLLLSQALDIKNETFCGAFGPQMKQLGNSLENVSQSELGN
jgi:hypothetical protein